MKDKMSDKGKVMLELRLLADHDVTLMESWLHKPHVKKWYEVPELGVTIDDWLHEIKERHGEFNWLNQFIVIGDGEPIGFCQYYRCEDSGDENFGALPLAGSYGIDYLIGEEAYLGKGLGKEMIALLIERVFSFPDAQRVTAEIDKNNKASAQALLSCGFELVAGEDSRYVIRKELENLSALLDES